MNDRKIRYYYLSPVSATVVADGLLLASTGATNIAQAQPSPWPTVSTFWAEVNQVGASEEPEFSGCYAQVLIVYMVDVGALRKDGIVLTKDRNICSLLETAFLSVGQAKFTAKLRLDLPQPAALDIGGRGKLIYDVTRICVYC